MLLRVRLTLALPDTVRKYPIIELIRSFGSWLTPMDVGSGSRGFSDAEGDDSKGGSLHFVAVQFPNGPCDKAARRRAKSHAVRQAIEKKRKLQQELRTNFCAMMHEDTTGFSKKKASTLQMLPPSLYPLFLGVLDPFQMLPVDTRRLQELLVNHRARHAPEPVFSVKEELAFQRFSSVFPAGSADPALLNAVMLSLAVAETEGSIDRECLNYQGKTLACIRENITSPEQATSEATIGAILLLAGVEARLGRVSQVQLHMNAVKQVLDLSRSRRIHLTAGIKRAIFWQDLNSSVIAGSTRIVSHTTFAELHWSRDPFSPTFFQLPPGFGKRSYMFSEPFIEVIEDIHGLQCIRDVARFTQCDVTQMAFLNNHIASIHSRLMMLSGLGQVTECCRLAAYLCSAMLCCTVWCALVIPPHISRQLLYQLRESRSNPLWDEHKDLLVWLLYTGGALSPEDVARSEYVELLRENNVSRFGGQFESWPELLQTLEQFIWPKEAFTSRVRELWTAVYA
ncbi:uncharacterized protein PV09_08155 [Verruconis gallopava]|uniref:Transcription factor domain-containing protein n=1 Tax=Verruconis gallopava TaxID=253628 RepID=A0A0D2A1R8_9PEZI|nr:uncharacterized protein PV09_08155 [Verruconis gallopava]KIW00265.1 hypothetical protein PV09_08155 [Verruconis gallopava]